MVPCSKPFTCRAPPYTLSTLTNFCFSHISLGQPALINDSHAVYMHQITLHVLCRPAGGVEPSELPFFLLFLLSRFPLSSLSLVNSNPPVPSLLPLTYKFLIENPVSLHLFLLSRFSCSFSDTAASWKARPPSGLNLHFWFSLVSFFFCWFPFERLSLWFPPDSQWQWAKARHLWLEDNDFKMSCLTSHNKWSASILPMSKFPLAVRRSRKTKTVKLLTSLITFLTPCWFLS